VPTPRPRPGGISAGETTGSELPAQAAAPAGGVPRNQIVLPFTPHPSAPSAAKTEPAKPETAKPEAAKPAAVKPDATRTEAAGPVTLQPGTTMVPVAPLN
jgi:hypothetical protein